MDSPLNYWDRQCASIGCTHHEEDPDEMIGHQLTAHGRLIGPYLQRRAAAQVMLITPPTGMTAAELATGLGVSESRCRDILATFVHEGIAVAVKPSRPRRYRSTDNGTTARMLDAEARSKMRHPHNMGGN